MSKIANFELMNRRSEFVEADVSSVSFVGAKWRRAPTKG